MISTEDYFSSGDGTRLFERMWRPDGEPKAAVLIVHGYAEHSGRYAWTAGKLVERGYAVRSFDLRGHGKSDGERVYIKSMNEYLDDVDAALLRLRDAAPDLPLFVLGHSMGGGVASLYACERIPRGNTTRERIKGIVLSGGVLPVSPSIAASLLTAVVRAIGRVLPKWRMRSLGGAVSRDPAVVADYDADPLNYHGKMPAGLLAAMIRGLKYVDEHTRDITLPLLVLHGSADELTSFDGSQRFYDNASSTDKTIKIYEGLYHEILNEPEKDLVVEDIANWLDRQLAKQVPEPAAPVKTGL
jgi:alpha-beta hydrolase superfamily lysophospholipase